MMVPLKGIEPLPPGQHAMQCRAFHHASETSSYNAGYPAGGQLVPPHWEYLHVHVDNGSIAGMEWVMYNMQQGPWNDLQEQWNMPPIEEDYEPSLQNY